MVVLAFRSNTQKVMCATHACQKAQERLLSHCCATLLVRNDTPSLHMSLITFSILESCRQDQDLLDKRSSCLSRSTASILLQWHHLLPTPIINRSCRRKPKVRCHIRVNFRTPIKLKVKQALEDSVLWTSECLGRELQGQHHNYRPDRYLPC